MALTQMEPISARMVLPCFDEPDLKATFQVTIIHPKDTIALSNKMEMPCPEHILLIYFNVNWEYLKTKVRNHRIVLKIGLWAWNLAPIFIAQSIYLIINPFFSVDDEDEDFTRTCFKKTPKMSTYLLAFVAGQLEYLEAFSESGVRASSFLFFLTFFSKLAESR